LNFFLGLQETTVKILTIINSRFGRSSRTDVICVDACHVTFTNGFEMPKSKIQKSAVKPIRHFNQELAG